MPDRIVLFTPMAADICAQDLRETGLFTPVLTQDAGHALHALRDATGLVVGGSHYAALASGLASVATSLRWIQSTGAGTDIFERLGVPPNVIFMRAGGILGPAVASHAIALLLTLMRGIPDAIAAKQARLWNRDSFKPALITPAGRRILLLGYGDIGQSIARTLIGMGADLLIVASQARLGPDREAIYGIDQLDALLPEAEAVVMALPATTSTANLLNAARLARLRRGALLVNVGRGDALDEAALAAALTAGRLTGAALDVVREEPLPTSSPLWNCPNLILTPHVGGLGDRTADGKLARLIVSNAVKLARGEPPAGVVPMPRLSSGKGDQRV